MMKKMLAIILTCLMTLPLGMACAEITQTEDNAFSAQWIAEQSAQLLALGEGVTLQTQRYAFTLADGARLESLCLTASGSIRFGRYGQQVRTALINLDTGESVSLDALILDETALEERLTACVEGYQEQLNTYLDANDLLPVPLDSVCFTPRGLLIHYPAERFSFFSGNSGAVLIRYDLLADLLPAGVSPQDGLTAGQLAQQVRGAAAQGYLAGMPELRVGESLHAALTAYGTLTEPDYIEDGEIFEFESPLFYGAYAVAPRGAEDDEAALITAVRSREICLGGLSTGAAAQQDVIALLGEPQASVEISAETAEYNRLPVGKGLQYACGAYTLTFYFDTDTQLLYAVEIAATNP